jgi:hypothetical protein
LGGLKGTSRPPFFYFAADLEAMSTHRVIRYPTPILQRASVILTVNGVDRARKKSLNDRH